MGLTRSVPDRHTCPRHGCSVQVPNNQYACPAHWRELSTQTRAEIVRTRHRHVLDPERRAAFRMADTDWGQ